jgi:hypothetical protein
MFKCNTKNFVLYDSDKLSLFKLKDKYSNKLKKYSSRPKKQVYKDGQLNEGYGRLDIQTAQERLFSDLPDTQIMKQ